MTYELFYNLFISPCHSIYRQPVSVNKVFTASVLHSLQFSHNLYNCFPYFEIYHIVIGTRIKTPNQKCPHKLLHFLIPSPS